jgi:hypothetical protein
MIPTLTAQLQHISSRAAAPSARPPNSIIAFDVEGDRYRASAIITMLTAKPLFTACYCHFFAASVLLARVENDDDDGVVLITINVMSHNQ